MMNRRSFIRRILVAVGLVSLPSVAVKPKKLFVPDEPEHDLQWFYDNSFEPELQSIKIHKSNIRFSYFRPDGPNGFIQFEPPPVSGYDAGCGTLQS